MSTWRMAAASFQTSRRSADPRRWSDQGDPVDQLVRHRFGRFGPLAGEEEVLDLQRRLFEAEALGVVVVEVLVPCPHAADVERQLLLDRNAALRDVVAEADRHERQDVVALEALGPARLGEAFLERPLEEVEALRVHAEREHAVGDLGAGPDTGRRDGAGVDLQ